MHADMLCRQVKSDATELAQLLGTTGTVPQSFAALLGRCDPAT